MKTVILCGGYGTRIRDVSEDIPKPMIPIGDLPILWHIMKYYASFNHKDFVLCLGYKSQVIKEFFLNYKTSIADFSLSLNEGKPIIYYNDISETDWNITFAETGLNSMTGARVKKIKKYIDGDDTFMLTYGDGVGNINIKELVAYHKSHDKILTVSGVQPPGRFGELEITSEGCVSGFNEKPQSSGGFINGGYFVCNKEIFNYMDDREDLVFEKDPIIQLVKEQEMMVFKHEGFWQPMDTSREYQLLNDLFDEGNAPWIRW